jgi:hypothetical protein
MGEIDGAFRAWGVPKGGTGAIAYAIADAALSLGVEIRTEAPVARIATDGSRATGVILESGEEITADVVMSSLDSRWTFIKLLDDGILDPSFRDEVMRYKYRGSSGKVNLALDGLPELACKPGTGRVAPRRDLVLALDRLHRARLRRREVRPAVGASVHRLHHADARRPDDGAPRQARDELLRAVRALSPRRRQGVDDAAREAFGQNVIDTLEERFPDIRSKIVGHQFVTPKDIEDITGLTEGTSSRASSRSSSCSSTARSRVGRGTARRSRTCGCAARPRSPRGRHHGSSRSHRRARVPQGEEEGRRALDGEKTLDVHRDRRRPQRPRRRGVPAKAGKQVWCWSATSVGGILRTEPRPDSPRRARAHRRALRRPSSRT